MKKTGVILMAVILLAVSLTACGGEPPQPIERTDLNGVALYNHFIGNLKSAYIVKSYIGYSSWYDIVSCTREEIAFTEGESGERTLSYRQINPFVFWHRPVPNYYLNQKYYTEYEGEWYEDNNKHFSEQLSQDFLGISTAIWINETMENKVYEYPDHLAAHIVKENSGDNTRYIIDAKLDSDLLVQEISIIIEQRLDYDNVRKKHYKVSYSKVNEEISINPPQDLVEIVKGSVLS